MKMKCEECSMWKGWFLPLAMVSRVRCVTAGVLWGWHHVFPGICCTALLFLLVYPYRARRGGLVLYSCFSTP